ncbi:MAG: hypothetical protein PHN56_06610 [Candidatus Nanoarchaeia archaeon]|nr:hypothetical protein [Candidatus Nanoarchaeia archaeon]
MKNNMQELLTSNEVINQLYNGFLNKSEKIILPNKISVIYEKSIGEDRNDNFHAYYNEYLNFNGNIIIVKGRLESLIDYEFLRIFDSENKNAIEKLKEYNENENNFKENIFLLESEKGIQFAPIMKEIYEIRQLENSLTHKLSWGRELTEPKYSPICEEFDKNLSIQKKTLNSFIEKQEDSSEKYLPEITIFLNYIIQKTLNDYSKKIK